MNSKPLKYRNKLFAAAIFLLISQIAWSQSVKLLLIGDSWARQQLTSHIHQNVFQDNNLSSILVAGDTTTIGGSRSSQWATANNLQLITDAFTTHPTINTIQLTLGGNDILSLWNVSFTSQQVDDLLLQIQSNLEITINHILAINPNIEVILSFYDYPNFEDTLDRVGCNNIFNNMLQPTTFQLNSMFVSYEQLISQLPNDNPRVFYVSHLGVLQNHFGFPDDGITPGEIPLPGDITLPSPIASLRPLLGGETDCIHISNESYTLLVDNLYANYYHNRFSSIFSNGFE